MYQSKAADLSSNFLNKLDPRVKKVSNESIAAGIGAALGNPAIRELEDSHHYGRDALSAGEAAVGGFITITNRKMNRLLWVHL